MLRPHGDFRSKHVNRLCAVAVAGLFLAGSMICAYLALAESTNQFVAVEPVLKLGELGQGQKVDATFTLVNKGCHTMEIKQIWKSCDCTAVTYDSPVVAPGQACIVRVTWSTGRSRGTTGTDLSVVYTLPEGEAQRTDLQIQAIVKPDIEISSKRLMFASQTKSTQSVTLSPGQLSELCINRVLCTQRAFDAKVIPGTSVVEVTFDPKGWADDLSEALLLVETNSKNEPTIEITLAVEGTRRLLGR